MHSHSAKKLTGLSRAQLDARRRDAFRRRLKARTAPQLRKMIENRWEALRRNHEREAGLLGQAISNMRVLFNEKSRRRISELIAKLPRNADEKIGALERIYDVCIGQIRGKKPLPKGASQIAGIRRGNKRIMIEIGMLITRTVLLEER